MSSNSDDISTPPRNFRRPQDGAHFVEHAVDELVAVGTAVGFGQFYGLVDHHAVRRLGMPFHLAGAEQKDAALDGGNRVPGPVDVGRQRVAQGRDIGKGFRQQRRVEINVGLVETGHRFRLDSDGRFVLTADQVLVDALDDKLPGATPGIKGPSPCLAHFTTFNRLAISTAAWAASMPFWSMRSRAWSSFSVVSTALAIGMPVASCTSMMPRADSPATIWKW